MKRCLGIILLTLSLSMMLGTTSMAAGSERGAKILRMNMKSGIPDYDNPDPGDPMLPAVTYKVTISSGWLNIRNAPNTSGTIIGKLSNGAFFDWSLMQPSGGGSDWLYGSGKDMDTGKTVYGWVNSNYLSPIDDVY